MKTPLSPAEVHKQYEETLSAFLKTIPDATLRVRLNREADDFFRSLALGAWNADGGPITAGYVEYYNALYQRGNPAPSILFWELATCVSDYPGLQTPDFFHRMRAYDKVAGGDLVRRRRGANGSPPISVPTDTTISRWRPGPRSSGASSLGRGA